MMCKLKHDLESLSISSKDMSIQTMRIADSSDWLLKESKCSPCATLILDKFTIDKLIKVKDEVPMLHLDDVWIGQLIEHAGLVERMGQSKKLFQSGFNCKNAHSCDTEPKFSNQNFFQ